MHWSPALLVVDAKSFRICEGGSPRHLAALRQDMPAIPIEAAGKLAERCARTHAPAGRDARREPLHQFVVEELGAHPHDGHLVQGATGCPFMLRGSIAARKRHTAREWLRQQREIIDGDGVT